MLYEAARLASLKDVDLSKIVSHRYSLSNIEESMIATEFTVVIVGLFFVAGNFSTLKIFAASSSTPTNNTFLVIGNANLREQSITAVRRFREHELTFQYPDN